MLHNTQAGWLAGWLPKLLVALGRRLSNRKTWRRLTPPSLPVGADCLTPWCCLPGGAACLPACLPHPPACPAPPQLTKLVAEIDPKTKEQKKCKYIKAGGVCIARIAVERPICIETFEDLPTMGRFTLRDEGRTIAIGKVTKLPKK